MKIIALQWIHYGISSSKSKSSELASQDALADAAIASRLLALMFKVSQEDLNAQPSLILSINLQPSVAQLSLQQRIL